MKIRLSLLASMMLLATCALDAHATASGTPVAPKDPYIGAIVMDADTGQVLFEDNADAPVYPASVVKLMDMLIIEERIEQGSLKTNDVVRISREAARMGGTEIWADPRETFTVDAMIYALMVRSANDAAVALAEHIAGTKEAFVQMMNDRAKALGLNSTVYHSVNGLPANRNKGELPDITTARDMAVLGRELVKHPDVLRYTSTKHAELRDGKTEMDTHNRLLYTFEGCDGLKTGWTREGGYSIVATAKRNGHRLIAAVMGGKADKGRVRNAKTAELLSVAFVKLPPPPAPPVSTNKMVSTTNNVVTTNRIAIAKEEPQAPKPPRNWRRIWFAVAATLIAAWGIGAIIRLRSKRDFDRNI